MILNEQLCLFTIRRAQVTAARTKKSETSELGDRDQRTWKLDALAGMKSMTGITR